jgi:nucleoside-diphosphate-sugar epimerase
LLNNKKTVLVTGGAGYVGSVLIPELISNNYYVKCLDRFFFGKDFLSQEKFQNDLELIQDDIRWFDSKILKNVDIVLDLAALSNDPVGDLDQSKTFEINHKGRHRVAKLSKENDVDRYILASSASIYGQQDNIATEDSPVKPLTAYSKANRGAEIDNLPLNDNDFTVTVLRFSSVYGVSPRMRFDTAVNNMVLDHFIKKEINVNGKDNKRPFVFTKDVVKAYLVTMSASKDKISGEIFNVGSSDQNLTMADLANQIISSINGDCKLVVNDTNDHRSYFASFEKIKEYLGFTTDFTIKDGAVEIHCALSDGSISNDMKTKTVEWYKYLLKNPNMAKNLMINNTLL